MNELETRKKIIELCKQMNRTGLNQGTSGNISAVHKNTLLITPSGIAYDEMQPEQIAQMSLDSENDDWEGPCHPSSEWHFHKAILKRNPSFSAVVHTHSTFATILSIARKPIPSCHYMVAAFGGNNVRCARYATFGTSELSENILEAMNDRSACLMANHGMVAAGANLDKAMWAAIELEALAKQYYHACQQGSMVLLPNSEMDIIVEKFKTYGLKPSS
ncbi:MAG: class II aldolase [Gammaproteobacteria bacterium]|nr:class II aldolase [Gammaproteobacteria bacterium]